MADNEEAKPAGSKKLVIILAAALAVVLIAGGFVVMTLMNGNKAAAEPDPATLPGSIYAMEEPMTLNLSDGKFLKVGIALQMSKAGDAKLAAAGHSEKPDISAARDAAISILSKYTYEDLLKPEKKDEAQKKLTQEVSKRFEGGVLSVYFTEFVMQ